MSTLSDDFLARIRMHPQHREEIITVPTRPLHEILRAAGVATVDYLSLDIEGAEERVLNAFPFGEIDVLVWTIENNARSNRIADIIKQHGYVLVEFILVDEVYIREDFFVEIVGQRED